MVYLILALCLYIFWLLIRMKYLRSQNEINKHHKFMFDDLQSRIIKMVDRHKEELDNFDSHIDIHKLKKFIETNKIHDEYVGSMIITYELEQAIGSGTLNIGNNKSNHRK